MKIDDCKPSSDLVGAGGASLRDRYLAAIKDGYWPWAEVHPRRRFSEYDQFRAIWCDELWQWLYGDNPRKVYSLTAFAWAVQHARMSDGGYKIVCLNWSDRNQRVYLGDGLLEYLGLLKDEMELVYKGGVGTDPRGGSGAKQGEGDSPLP